MSKIHAQTVRLVKAFEKAVREHENSGSQHPEDQDSIQHATARWWSFSRRRCNERESRKEWGGDDRHP